MKKEVSKLFNQAESFRTEESRALGYKELCDKMAYEAGWHTVYVPNNRSKVKDRVKYSRPFNNILFFELLSRYKNPIIKQFANAGSLDSEKTEEKIYDVILRFMGTYNPEKVIADAQITSRMSLSIRQRAIECNFESNSIHSIDSSKVSIKNDKGELIGYHVLSQEGKRYFISLDGHSEQEVKECSKNFAKPDWRCRQNVSLESTVRVGKDQDEKSLIDYIPDENSFREVEFKEDVKDLEERFTSTESQKLLLNLLIEIGERTSPAKLLAEYVKETGVDAALAKKEVYKFYSNLKAKLKVNFAK